MFRRRPRIEQVENQGSVEPQLVLPAPSGAPLPLHLGLGPQAHLHGNSSSAYWGFPGVNAPREREWKNASEEAAAPGHLGGPCCWLCNGAGPAAARDPARTCPGPC